jgi:hypothetical protein
VADRPGMDRSAPRRGKSGWTTRGLEEKITDTRRKDVRIWTWPENIRIQNGEELTSQGMASEAAGEDLFAPHGRKLRGSGHGGEGLTGRLSDETFECMHAWTTSLVASCKPHAHVYGHRS